MELHNEELFGKLSKILQSFDTYFRVFNYSLPFPPPSQPPPLELLLYTYCISSDILSSRYSVVLQQSTPPVFSVSLLPTPLSKVFLNTQNARLLVPFHCSVHCNFFVVSPLILINYLHVVELSPHIEEMLGFFWRTLFATLLRTR